MDRLWLNRNWHWVTIIGIAVIIFLVWLGWKHGIAVSFAVLSIFVATFFASRSLKLTQDSLALTRAATRPFLHVSLGILLQQNLARIYVTIKNTGIHPADNALAVIEQFTQKQSDEKEQELKREEQPSPGVIVFPNGDFFRVSSVTAKHMAKLQAGQFYVRVSIDYQYKITKMMHKTVYTARAKPDPAMDTGFSWEMIPKKSYWT